MQLKTKFKVFGGYSVGVTPVLIPNTEVKSYRANDTALETVWESRSPPKLFERVLHPSRVKDSFLCKTQTYNSLERNYLKEY